MNFPHRVLLFLRICHENHEKINFSLQFEHENDCISWISFSSFPYTTFVLLFVYVIMYKQLCNSKHRFVIYKLQTIHIGFVYNLEKPLRVVSS